MGELIELGGITTLDIPVDRVLENAKGKISDDGVVLIGFDNDGELYFASSIADGGSVIWLLEMAKKCLLETEN